MWRYLFFKSWSLPVLAGWYHTLVTSLSPVFSLQNRCTAVESWNGSRIYFSWIIFYFVLQEPTAYAQYSVFNSTECCIFVIAVRKVIEAQLNQENIFVILNLTYLYGTIEKGAVIPSQFPFPFPIASFSPMVLWLLGGLGNFFWL